MKGIRIRRSAIIASILLLLGGCGGANSSIGSDVTISPATASVLPGGQKQFTVDQNVAVDWTAPDGGTVVDGLFTAPGTIGNYRVIATNSLNPTKLATAIAKVSTVAVSISPETLLVAQGSVNTDVVTAFVSGSANKAVTWTLSSADAGSIGAGSTDGSGNPRATFTAGTTPGIYQIRATPVADSSVVGIATVQVMGSSALGLNPGSVSLSTTAPNNAVTLTAVLTDGAGKVDTTTVLIWDVPLNPVGGTLTGSDLRQRVFTVPTTFIGTTTCQVRVRTSEGIARIATIQVSSG